MTLPREAWPRLKEAFDGARALALDVRPAYLAEVCKGDEALRHEVELLLAHYDQAASFLETPAMQLDDGPVAKSLEGQCIGPYQISALIGTGGTGEVYSARDTKLNRLVAIKVLLPALANDPDRLAWFSREAQLLASLNHPHIAQIHGFENADGLHALVMELVEGPTLADRITQGAIPIDEALAMAKQIADAVEAAHEQGIIHRDLKPANIKVRPDGTVKVLDFGLAKALASDVTATQGISQSPTVAIDASRVGVILGTAAYMSPEQARGLPVDTRADIWAFGCVLYEMLTGRRPFTGETIPETLAAILEREPDWNAFPASSPGGIRELVRRCLQRDLALRVQNIAEARGRIEKAQRGWNRWRVAALSAAVVATLAVSAAVWWREPARPVDRSEWVQLTQFPDSVIHPALSPDGSMLAFIRSPSGSTPFGRGQVFLKRLPNGEPVQLTNDDLAKLSPVFSPDGSRIAYGTVNPGRFEWDIWTVPVLGGEPQPWLQASSSWNHSEIPGELRLMDLETGRSEVVMPGFQTLNYDVSVDGQQVVMEIADRDGTSRFWISAFDRASPPRPIAGVEGKEPRFGRNGDIWFRRTEGSSGFVYRVRPDGTGMQKVFDKPIFIFGGMSRDGRWIKAFTVPDGNGGPSWQALPLDGGPSVPISTYTWHWSTSEDSVAISGAPLPAGRSYIVPLRTGQFLPLERREGARSEREVAELPGARRIDADMVVPGPSPDIYAFYRTTTQRNLYRIPIR